MSQNRDVSILLVEDNHEDVDLTRELLSEAGFANEIVAVNDGEEALEYLHGRGAYADRQVPDLVLLDLSLPRRSGHEVLDEMQDDVALSQLPVFVLSTSRREDDIVGSYERRVKAFLRKPLDPDELAATVRTLPGFGLSIVRV